jgi:uncharacterized protein YprB with RNaseH-like and TPR domain
VSFEDLASKLKRLKQNLPAGVLSASDLLRQPSVPQDLPDVSRFIPGEVQSMEGDSCFVSDEFFPFDQEFGRYPLANLRNLDPHEACRVFAIGPAEEEGRILFIDTETTGLAGGTGTYAFLVGIGWIEEEGFRVLQFFMRDYDEEAGQMRLLAEELKQCGLLVTYNGAAFDLPLLKTRFVFNRVRFPLMQLPHLDLLPVARRLWKPAHGAANLSFLESKILGNDREGDVPGSLIPTLYFNFLRGASPRTLAPVFYHNRMDIVALAALTERAFTCHRQPEAIHSLWERLGVARFMAARGLENEATAILAPVEDCCEGTTEWHLCSRFLAGILKRQKESSRAASLWWKIYQTGTFDPHISIELAKHLEHVEKDIEQAQRIVLEVFEKYQVEPLRQDKGGVENSVESGATHYDFSEWASPRRDHFPVIRVDRDLGDGLDNQTGLAVPPWSARLSRELNHRLHRLNRRLKLRERDL